MDGVDGVAEHGTERDKMASKKNNLDPTVNAVMMIAVIVVVVYALYKIVPALLKKIKNSSSSSGTSGTSGTSGSTYNYPASAQQGGSSPKASFNFGDSSKNASNTSGTDAGFGGKFYAAQSMDNYGKGEDILATPVNGTTTASEVADLSSLETSRLNSELQNTTMGLVDFGTSGTPVDSTGTMDDSITGASIDSDEVSSYDLSADDVSGDSNDTVDSYSDDSGGDDSNSDDSGDDDSSSDDGGDDGGGGNDDSGDDDPGY